MILKKIIQVQRTLEVDLGKDTTLKKVINLPSWDMTGIKIIDLLQENDLPDIIDTSVLIDDNIVCLKILTGKSSPGTIFHLQYFPIDKKIIINGKYYGYYWTEYMIFFFSLLLIVLTERSKNDYFFPLFTFILFLYASWIIHSTIRGDVKHIERELTIRINYDRRHNKR